MKKKLTISLDPQVYAGLQRVIGPDGINRFIEDLVRPYVLRDELEAGYREMALDEARETEAIEWSEATIQDAGDEPRRCGQTGP